MKIERVIELSKEKISSMMWNFGGSTFDEKSTKVFLDDKKNYLVVAEEGGKIIGILRGHYFPRFDIKKASILLYEIDVHPEHRRKGIGTKLIEKLKDIAYEEKVPEIWVITNKSNTAAMQLYTSTGAIATHDDDIVLEYHI